MLRFFNILCLTLFVSQLAAQHYVFLPFQSSFEQVTQHYQEGAHSTILSVDEGEAIEISYHESFVKYSFAHNKLFQTEMVRPYHKRNHVRKALIGAINYFKFIKAETIYYAEDEKREMQTMIFQSSNTIFRLLVVKRGKKDYVISLKGRYFDDMPNKDFILHNLLEMPMELIFTANAHP